MKNSMARFEQWFQGSIFAKATAPTKDAMHEAWQGALQAAEAEQDAIDYPACDTCGTHMDYMPWHYSEGGERHLHACDTCWWNENPAAGGTALQAKILIDRVVEELENGFVACERCGDQEDTATLDCMSDLKKLKGLLAKPGDGVPDGWKLAPERLNLDYQSMKLIQLMAGDTENEDDFSECVLWIGEVVNDDGARLAYGLNIACIECLEEGSVTVFEFDPPQPPGEQEQPND